jgi:MoaA/NifB/PqqE/SkfB family radical SAM enzyme
MVNGNQNIREAFKEMGGSDAAEKAKAYTANMKHQLRLVFWETTVGCNLECIHCRRLEVSRELAKEDLTTAEAFKFLDSLASFAKPILVLSGGEPLFRPDIFEIARYAKDKGLTVALATNGTLVTREIAVKVKEAGIQRVSVSLDGATPKVHDEFRKLPGSFEAALRGLALLKEAGVETQVNCTIARHNVHQVEEIYNLTGKCGDSEYRGLCMGCRARAYYAKGDFMAEEPYCVYQPKHVLTPSEVARG